MESLLELNSRLVQEEAPFDVNPKYFSTICTFHDSLIKGHCAVANMSQGRLMWCKKCVQFVTCLITGIEDVIPQEAIMYCINSDLRMKAILEPDNILHDVIDKAVFTLYTLLNDHFQKLLLNNLVVALANLCTYNCFICVNVNCKELILATEYGQKYVIKPKRFEVNFKMVDKMIRWILSFVYHYNKSPELLSPLNGDRLWLATLKIIAKNEDETLLTLCYRIVYYQLMWNRYNGIFAITLLDLILCREEELLADLSKNILMCELDRPSRVQKCSLKGGENVVSDKVSLPNTTQQLDSVCWACLKTIVLHIANADANKSLGIRTVRCSLYFALIRRMMRALHTHCRLPPTRVFRLAEFVLNSLPVICAFRAVLKGNEEWIILTNQMIFSILDFLEKFSFDVLERFSPPNAPNSTDNAMYKQVCDLLRSILEEEAPEERGSSPREVGVPLCVLAAEKCNCYFRALRWLEQHGIKESTSNFQRELFCHLERLYINLDDVDGVWGAFSTIQNNVTPTPTEHILALEAKGDYAEALPLCRTVKGHELTIIKCHLRGNDPYTARNDIEHLRKSIDFDTADIKFKAALIDLQMEATCRLSEWEQLKLTQKEYLRFSTSLTERDKLAVTNCLSTKKAAIADPNANLREFVVSHSWGAQVASIFCSLKMADCHAFDEQIRSARSSLINSVLSMTFESSESYSQIHKYVVRLHALREVEDARKVIFDKDKMSIEMLVEKWEHVKEEKAVVEDFFYEFHTYINEIFKKKSETSNSINDLEPIIDIRRGLLRVIDQASPAAREALCRLLLQSARLSRRAGHLQKAWTYLVEARNTNVKTIEIDMEASRYYFQKKEQTQAIHVLQKAIESTFPEMSAEFSKALRNNKVDSVNRALFVDFSTRKPFVQAYLLLAEFLEKANANRFDSLLCIYQSLERCGEESEAFFYHYAVFFDRYCESMKEGDDEMVFNLLRLYGSVLKQGAKYLQHVMPRMLTVWLDFNPKQFQKPIMVAAQKKSNARDINAKMRENFNELNHYYFYTCFSQLISRITHSNPAVFKTLKQILSDLIAVYPHQCLWRSIAISRSNQSKVRRDRCLEVYDLAKKRCTSVDLTLLINQYSFLAESLIQIAEDTNKRVTAKFADVFPFVARFFADGTMTRGGEMVGTIKTARSVAAKKARISATSGGRNSLGAAIVPQLMLPFIDEIMEQNSTSLQSCSTSISGIVDGQSSLGGCHGARGGGDFDAMTCFSQIDLVDSRQQNSSGVDFVYRFKEVFIKGVADDYEVLQSMAAPKRMTFIGSDGKRYPLLCKAMDELRKDARFMDVNRMLNSLFQRDTDARRRQLFVRCYGVIPLQETGGIIEWVPNLVTMAGAIRPLVKERAKPIAIPDLQRVSDIRLSDEERLKNFREFLCARTPLVLAEWFRRKFHDAGRWYNARLAFTRTAATMSIIGFIFGLGDRHAENILIDTTTGEVMHVDFNILFNKGEFLRVPEIVPFRLTRNMVNAFGATGVEGAFRLSSETVMRVMRKEQCMLVTVLQAFVHDPLMEWTVAESRNQQTRQLGGPALQISECQEAHDTLEMIRLRLAGNIVTARFQKLKDSMEMSVEGQVGKLIEMAVDDANLSKMYVGWNAFL